MFDLNKTVGLLPVLLSICLFVRPAEAGYNTDSEITASSGTSTYIFLPDQSTVVQTGGIAGVRWIYSVEGQFRLTFDPNAGTAFFSQVDANAVDDSPYRRTLDPNEVFSMTDLVGIVIDDTIIVFTGKATDGSDVLLVAILNDDLIYLVGQTYPPAGSADFFIFNMDAAAQRKYDGGSGEPNDPYLICTAEQMISISQNPGDWDKHFILTANIDLDPNLPGSKVFDKAVIAPDIDLTKWDFQGTLFTGIFDGSGHAISHLTIVGKDYLGLFGRLGANAEVKNLGVVDVNITGSGDCVGGLVGHNEDVVLTNCYSTGVVNGNSAVGGLVGYIGRAAFNCYSAVTVSGDYEIGGLVGSNLGTLAFCYSVGTVSGGSEVGGLVGLNRGTVTQCYSAGSVIGNYAIGGLIGQNGAWGHRDYPGYIDISYSTANVIGETFVGGFVGDNECGTVNRCYSAGLIGGKEIIGGLVGRNWGDVNVCFWDIETSGQTTSAGGTGLTTAEMQTVSTFLDAGWDFIGETENGTEDIWWIDEGQDYPRLTWELAEEP